MGNELLTHVAMSIVDAQFRCSTELRFYAQPPVGYGVVAFPHCGYVVAVDWVAKLFATPDSQPFVIGSKLHDATIAEVLDIHFKEFIDVDVTKIKWDPRSGPSAFWTAFPSMRTTANGQRGQPVPEGDAPLGVRTLI